MPASTLDPINAAIRSSLTKGDADNSLDARLAGSTKKALLANIQFEPAGSYQSTVLDKLKSKYIVLKSAETPQASKPEEESGSDESKFSNYELFPLKNVQLGWNKCDWSTGAGMINMGNTCYLNSTLQALFHVPALVNWLMSDKEHISECQDSGLCIICAMRKTLQDSQQRNTTTIRPLLIYNKLRLVCRNLIPGRQEDAHEFLRYLIEAMEKSFLMRFKNHTEFDSRVKETTPLNQILGGYLRSAVGCLKCGHVSTTVQHFQDLLLDIRKAQSLDEALEAYFSKEKLDDEAYQCEACQKKVPATKQFTLERAPMVLCIQLKRFSVSNNKITKHLDFRQRLDITRYARQRPSVPLIYRLVALVTHMGPTVNCGHYTAVAQAPSGNFYQFDDSMVRMISHQAVFNTNAYVMLYELESNPYAQNNVKSAPLAATEHADTNNKPTENGAVGVTSERVYGPELPPPNFDFEQALLYNSYDVQMQRIRLAKTHIAPNAVNRIPKKHWTFPLDTQEQNKRNGNKKQNGNDSEQPVAKLVPYETDSSGSDESNHSAQEAESVVSTKAALAEWQVTSTSDVLPDKSWEGQKNGQTDAVGAAAAAELCKMSHNGYSAPVASWNGTRSHLDKEVKNERREERKRALSDNCYPGRVKHQKICNNSNNGNYKSNPGYNPIQEFHNSKNWSQGNGSGHYKQFYSNNRHRRNFHHKNFHKNYRFRQ